MTKVALGICTYQRPAYLEKCTKSIARNCASAIDDSFVYNDGSDPKLSGSYKRAYAPLTAIGGHITEAAVSSGQNLPSVAVGNSRKALRTSGCSGTNRWRSPLPWVISNVPAVSLMSSRARNAIS